MKVLVIHGPNLNLLGLRETSLYGSATLAEIDKNLRLLAAELACEIDTVQTNHEGALIEAIQQAPAKGVSGILINPAAYGHTSIALRDALLAVGLPFVEVHISNIYARESFRHHTYLSDIASGLVAGFGATSYLIGLRGLVSVLRPA